MSAEPLAGGLLALQTRMTAYLLQPDAEALTAGPDVQGPITPSDADGNGAPNASPM